ncbi:Fanconi anemia group B protein isoform X2 [Brienomyrus brachyistius]|nr:Fanconi anemia group B protein isoform X2 [Brienomyrus brachyistius]XP_048834108.1 Fanconi anemia group B protein isoform X2 [Brienomyrus brachyistius]XP_048834109.1 Fanconi anemia group B protein isoform X2 [Brienomyrus brachyistius]
MDACFKIAPLTGSTMVSPKEQCIRLLAFNSDILLVQLAPSFSERESQSGSELRFRRMSFGREAGHFLVRNESKVLVSKRATSQFGLVTCAPAVDVKNGQLLPCILLKQQKRKTNSFKYILLTLSSSDSFERHLEFKLPYEMKDNVTIARGPTVLWSHANSIFYTSVEVGEVQQVNVQLLSVYYIGELPIGKRNTMILGSQKSAEKDHEKQPKITWPHQAVGYFLEDGELFDGACILPNAYISVVKCIFFVSAEQVGDKFESSLVAATSKNQLVRFETGIPKDICKLPFEEPENVQLADTGLGGCFFLVSFQGGNVCAIWKNSFQVAHCWEGVSSLHVDDFVACGTDQLLMLFEKHEPPEGALAEFVITDLGDMTYTTRQNVVDDASGAADSLQENYLRMVQVLESRLQLGMTSLRDLQRELEVKDRLLLQSVKALVDAVSGREYVVSRADQEGLVSLWDEDVENEGPDERLTAFEPHVLPVEKIWQRVVEDRLVVGVVLTEQAASSVESVSMSLLSEDSQGLGVHVLQTHSRMFWFPCPSTVKEPPAKRTKQDRSNRAERLTVTVVTDLAPLVACGRIQCAVLLHTGCSKGAAFATLCGHVSLDIQDVAQGKYCPHLVNCCKFTTEECSEDLLSLLAAWESCSFVLRSPERTLHCVPQWLLGVARSEPVVFSPGYFLFVAAEPGAAILFHWQERTPFQGELRVCCRSQTQLLQVLDSLCHFLPPSCEVQHIRGKAAEELVLVLASSLEREALSLRDGVSSLLSAASMEVQGRAQEYEKVQPMDELQAHRIKMERDRERSRSAWSPLVEMEQYRGLSSTVSQFGLEGDLVAYSLGEVLYAPPAVCLD